MHQHRPAENPDVYAAIVFDIVVSLVWFLLRVQSNDGDDKKPTRESVMEREARWMLCAIRVCEIV